MTLISEHPETRIKELEAQVAALQEQLALYEASSPERVILLRTISEEEAKAEIIGLFATGETLYYSDISERLRIDLPVVVEICRELEAAGAIGVDDDPV